MKKKLLFIAVILSLSFSYIVKAEDYEYDEDYDYFDEYILDDDYNEDDFIDDDINNEFESDDYIIDDNLISEESLQAVEDNNQSNIQTSENSADSTSSTDSDTNSNKILDNEEKITIGQAFQNFKELYLSIFILSIASLVPPFLSFEFSRKLLVNYKE